MLSEPILDALAERLGRRPVRSEPLSGGDINEAFAVRFADGDSAFVKTHHAAPPGMYGAEAAGLDWLRQTASLNLPEVLCYSDEFPSFLALSFVAPGARGWNFDELLGHSLAGMHRATAEHFGLGAANFIGTLRQENPLSSDWPTFYREARLQPQIRLATEGGRMPSSWSSRFERLLLRLPSLSGPPEPPSRLHGDLWSGNILVGSDGEPVLIDPAVYAGHREMDLAMMRLFGGFRARTFSAYSDCYPLAPGSADRVPLYQLYPLMVHLNLFGGGYAGQVDEALTSLGF